MKSGEISLNSIYDNQAAFKFKDDVEVFYTGTYVGEDINGEFDLIGCWNNGEHKWIHSQISLRYDNANYRELLQKLINYALNID